MDELHQNSDLESSMLQASSQTFQAFILSPIKRKKNSQPWFKILSIFFYINRKAQLNEEDRKNLLAENNDMTIVEPNKNKIEEEEEESVRK